MLSLRNISHQQAERIQSFNMRVIGFGDSVQRRNLEIFHLKRKICIEIYQKFNFFFFLLITLGPVWANLKIRPASFHDTNEIREQRKENEMILHKFTDHINQYETFNTRKIYGT